MSALRKIVAELRSTIIVIFTYRAFFHSQRASFLYWVQKIPIYALYTLA